VGFFIGLGIGLAVGGFYGLRWGGVRAFYRLGRYEHTERMRRSGLGN
jgi:hypothetical protein